jgi:hypothetical protein
MKSQPKQDPKITKTLAQKSQKPENFSQKTTQNFTFLGWDFLGLLRLLDFLEFLSQVWGKFSEF